MRHFHVAVGLSGGEVVQYYKFDGMEESAICFIDICKKLTGANVGRTEDAYAALMKEAEEENFFVSSTNIVYVIGWTDCYEGQCATRYWN